jgi:uncharacterized membrane protein
MLLAADRFSTSYKIVLLLHLLSVIFGIGTVVLNGIYAAQAQKRPGAPGRAVSEANFFVSNVAEKIIYTIPIWGLALVGMSDDAWKFSQVWIWLSLVLYVVAIGISHAVMIPGHKRINELLAEMETTAPPAGGAPPQVAEIQQLGQKQAQFGAALDLIVVVLVLLMIFKPGA